MFSQFLKELVSFNNYKSSQGRVARRLTFIGLSLVFLWGAYSLFSSNYSTEENASNAFCVVSSALVAILGVWCSFRVINIPTFADFLVSVEAEMSKVSWPSKRDLIANTKVVLIFMVLFTALILVYDLIFQRVFGLLG